MNSFDANIQQRMERLLRSRFKDDREAAIKKEQEKMSAIFIDYGRRNMRDSSWYYSEQAGAIIQSMEGHLLICADSALEEFHNIQLEITSDVRDWLFKLLKSWVDHNIQPHARQVISQFCRNDNKVIEQLNQILNRGINESLAKALSKINQEMERNYMKRKTQPAQANATKKLSVPVAPEFDSKEYDVFICHASEDKKGFVYPLAIALRDEAKLKVWYDSFSLKVGDSLREAIDNGILKSKYGVVILSEAFFSRHWPIKELNGLAQREEKGKRIILPVWHNINKEYVMQFSPMLADRCAAFSDAGVPHVVEQLLIAMDILYPMPAKEGSMAPPKIDVVFCSGDSDEDEFIDTDGKRKKAVILKRHSGWNPLEGSEYIWAKMGPAEHEACDGCRTELLRNIRLDRKPSYAKLSMQVDDVADLFIDKHRVRSGIRGYSGPPHEINLTAYLVEGDNLLRIILYNDPMPGADRNPDHNPTGIAYRLEVQY